jgi:hypothetical protein
MAKTQRTDIVEAKKYLGFMSWRSWREVNKLESYLKRGELVEAICSGNFGGGGGIIVLTNTRVIFLKDGWLSKTVQDFALQRISSVEWRSGLFYGKLMIFGDSVEEEINKVWAFTGSKVAKMIQDKSGRMPDPNYQQQMYPPQQGYPGQQAGYPQPYQPQYPQAPQQAAPPVAPQAPVVPVSSLTAPDAFEEMQQKLTRLDEVARQHNLPAAQVERLKAKILHDYEQATLGA